MGLGLFVVPGGLWLCIQFFRDSGRRDL